MSSSTASVATADADKPPAPITFFLKRSDKDDGHQYSLEDGHFISFGRSADDNQVVVASQDASSKHAELYRDGDGLNLKDMSKNGTGVRILGGRKYETLGKGSSLLLNWGTKIVIPMRKRKGEFQVTFTLTECKGSDSSSAVCEGRPLPPEVLQQLQEERLRHRLLQQQQEGKLPIKNQPEAVDEKSEADADWDVGSNSASSHMSRSRSRGEGAQDGVPSTSAKKKESGEAPTPAESHVPGSAPNTERSPRKTSLRHAPERERRRGSDDRGGSRQRRKREHTKHDRKRHRRDRTRHISSGGVTICLRSSSPRRRREKTRGRGAGGRSRSYNGARVTSTSGRQQARDLARSEQGHKTRQGDDRSRRRSGREEGRRGSDHHGGSLRLRSSERERDRDGERGRRRESAREKRERRGDGREAREARHRYSSRQELDEKDRRKEKHRDGRRATSATDGERKAGRHEPTKKSARCSRSRSRTAREAGTGSIASVTAASRGTAPAKQPSEKEKALTSVTVPQGALADASSQCSSRSYSSSFDDEAEEEGPPPTLEELQASAAQALPKLAPLLGPLPSPGKLPQPGPPPVASLPPVAEDYRNQPIMQKAAPIAQDVSEYSYSDEYSDEDAQMPNTGLLSLTGITLPTNTALAAITAPTTAAPPSLQKEQKTNKDAKEVTASEKKMELVPKNDAKNAARNDIASHTGQIIKNDPKEVVSDKIDHKESVAKNNLKNVAGGDPIKEKGHISKSDAKNSTELEKNCLKEHVKESVSSHDVTEVKTGERKSKEEQVEEDEEDEEEEEKHDEEKTSQDQAMKLAVEDKKSHEKEITAEERKSQPAQVEKGVAKEGAEIADISQIEHAKKDDVKVGGKDGQAKADTDVQHHQAVGTGTSQEEQPALDRSTVVKEDGTEKTKAAVPEQAAAEKTTKVAKVLPSCAQDRSQSCSSSGSSHHGARSRSRSRDRTSKALKKPDVVAKAGAEVKEVVSSALAAIDHAKEKRVFKLTATKKEKAAEAIAAVESRLRDAKSTPEASSNGSANAVSSRAQAVTMMPATLASSNGSTSRIELPTPTPDPDLTRAMKEAFAAAVKSWIPPSTSAVTIDDPLLSGLNLPGVMLSGTGPSSSSTSPTAPPSPAVDTSAAIIAQIIAARSSGLSRPNSVRPPFAREQKPCFRFLHGKCSNEFCSQKHITDPVERQQVFERYQKIPCNQGLLCTRVKCMFSHNFQGPTHMPLTPSFSGSMGVFSAAGMVGSVGGFPVTGGMVPPPPPATLSGYLQ